MRNYKNINAFKLADQLTMAIYGLTKKFPQDEQFGLVSQLRRSAVSVAANIVEGSARQSKKDYLHFLYMSRASLAESEYLLHLSRKLNYLSESQYVQTNMLFQDVAKTLYGLICAVEKEIKTI